MDICTEDQNLSYLNGFGNFTTVQNNSTIETPNNNTTSILSNQSNTVFDLNFISNVANNNMNNSTNSQQQWNYWQTIPCVNNNNSNNVNRNNYINNSNSNQTTSWASFQASPPLGTTIVDTNQNRWSKFHPN